MSKVKKPFYKRWWFIALVVVFVLGSIGGGGKDKTEEVASQKEEQIIEVDSEEEEVIIEEPEEVEASQGDLEQLSLAIFKESFEGSMEVGYIGENKSYTLLPVDEALVKELSLLAMGNESMMEGWESMVSGVITMSKSLNENLGSGYSLHLLNPVNQEAVLLTCVDGVVLYDFTNEL